MTYLNRGAVDDDDDDDDDNIGFFFQQLHCNFIFLGTAVSFTL